MYMRANLHDDLVFYNRQLAKTGRAGIHFRASGRNGYTGLDIYDDNGRALSTLATGTPKECREAVLSYIVQEL